jgi:hypothetical protein
LTNRAVGERQAVWLITASAVIGRLATLSQPMRYDESVTWAYFVGRPWSTIVSSYPFPNNHVFFSLLAKATSALAPFQPWALRLPAFIAGVAVVPLTWAVGRRYAGSTAGLLAAALAAGCTTLMLYSTNARGYSLVVALFLVLLLLADRLRERARLGDFALFAAVAAIGLYTIPVMLYPLGVVGAWLLLVARREGGAAGRRLAVGVVAASALAVAIAGLLYEPIIRTAGVGALTGNRFVQASTWPVFLADLPRHVIETLLTWTSPLPWWLAPLLLVAALFGLRRPGPSDRPSLVLATAGWCSALLLLTHRVPFVRVWLFLVPLFLLAVARGMVHWARGPRAQRVAASPLAAVAIAALVTSIALVTDAVRSSADTGAFPAAHAVTDRLAGEIRAGDRVLAPIPTNGPLLYYFSQRGLDTAVLSTPPDRTRRAYLVLDPERGRSLNWAVSVGMIDPSRYADPTLLMREPGVELWRTERR